MLLPTFCHFSIVSYLHTVNIRSQEAVAALEVKNYEQAETIKEHEQTISKQKDEHET